jgi:hypothetical protein
MASVHAIARKPPNEGKRAVCRIMGAYLGVLVNVATETLPPGALLWQAADKPARYTAHTASSKMSGLKNHNSEAT